jgi:DNA-binding NtrC family response regulator
MAGNNNKKSLLVVEDNDFVRMQIVKFLSETGLYDITESSRADEALDSVGADTALAIVDVRMEPMDGLAFIRSLRGLDMETPVVLVTGDQNPDLLNESGKLGVAAVLMKPVQKDRLLKTVDRIVNQDKR